MSYTCIVFSDPRTTTGVQVATREGDQTTANWLGVLKFANLKVFQGQSRVGTCTFQITDYNTTDNITYWMVPATGVFVIDEGVLRFSGVITRVDGEYIAGGGNTRHEIYNVTCESDANYLAHLVTPTKAGTKHTSATPMTIIKDIVDPYTNWYDRLATPSTYLDNTLTTSYTVSKKPAMTQIIELASSTGYKYRVRTKTTVGTATVSGTTVTMSNTTPDVWITATSNLGWGTHNKYIAVVLSQSTTSYHNAACAVTATAAGSFTITSTGAINYALFTTGKSIMLIQHPIIEFQKNFNRTTSKVFNSTTDDSALLCWDYSPNQDKNDVITNLSCTFTDELGIQQTLSMPAAFRYNSTTRHFVLADGFTYSYLTTAQDSTIVEHTQDLVTNQKVLIYQDGGYNPNWTPGEYVTLCSADVVGALENFSAAAGTPTDAGRTVAGHKTWYLGKATVFSNYYKPGDVVTHANASTGTSSNLYPYYLAGFTVGYYWVGCELVQATSLGPPLVVTRGATMVSSKGYTIQKKAITHRVGCPVFPAGTGATGSKYLGQDDYYNGSGTNDAPIKTYGFNSKTVNLSKAADCGTVEIILYNILRNVCLPKLKGDLKCMISSLLSPTSVPMIPGDLFTVSWFGTTDPTTGSYEIVSMDMDFDSGTATVQFGEYDITLMNALSQFGINITIT